MNGRKASVILQSYCLFNGVIPFIVSNLILPLKSHEICFLKSCFLFNCMILLLHKIRKRRSFGVGIGICFKISYWSAIIFELILSCVQYSANSSNLHIECGYNVAFYF